VSAGLAILLAGSAAGAMVVARVQRARINADVNADIKTEMKAGAVPPAIPITPPPAALPTVATDEPARDRPAPERRRANRPAHTDAAGAGLSPEAAAALTKELKELKEERQRTSAQIPSQDASLHQAPVTPRGVPEVLAEAEKLLGQGEVTDACARGEEANRLAPKSAPVHKFLGQCYMRAGRTREANDNYKQYLELAPAAPDAPFVKSMIR
jgi:tetratricopeptide (TPR) repeat protein